jgi:circadian clock protein KaiB
VDAVIYYQLKLFVAGDTLRGQTAIENLKRLCDEAFSGGYDLTIVDVLRHPEIAEREKILATPTLVKETPLPVRRIIGDFSDKEKVLAALSLVTQIPIV